MSVENAQVKFPFLDTQIEKWRALNKQKEEKTNQIVSLTEKQTKAYSELGYWDSFVNFFPTFISSIAAFDYLQLISYNQISRDIQLHKDKVSALQIEKKEVMTQIFSYIIEDNQRKPVIKMINEHFDRISELNQFVNKVLKALEKAKNSEWLDGLSADQTYFGAMNEFESKKDNLKVAHLLNDLNNMIRNVNAHFLKIDYQACNENGCLFAPFSELYGAGENVLDAELNESHPYYRLGGSAGDWYASQNTMNVLKGVETSVKYLQTQIRNQMISVQKANHQYIKAQILEYDPGFYEEANFKVLD